MIHVKVTQQGRPSSSRRLSDQEVFELVLAMFDDPKVVSTRLEQPGGNRTSLLTVRLPGQSQTTFEITPQNGADRRFSDLVYAYAMTTVMSVDRGERARKFSAVEVVEQLFINMNKLQKGSKLVAKSKRLTARQLAKLIVLVMPASGKAMTPEDAIHRVG